MSEQKEINRRFEVAVVGVTFEGRQELLAELYATQEETSEITGRLQREPENRFDPNAIAVSVEGQHIGYIPKALAAKLAAHIDAGDLINVVGVRIIKGDKDGGAVYGARIDVEMQAKNEKEAV